jgi:glycosyltransferase involved in cell wall biosynthesis
MKVKDLIKDSTWRPGKLYDPKVKPALSVLLPTFRRGKSGLFRRAVESVLDQTLEDIELIIIDDASTDGTADQIKEFMRKDGRVSVITHPRNVGLPAISEYEAFMRARADYFAFAFDDDFFYRDALERLLEHGLKNPGKVCYGHVLMRYREPGSLTEHLVPYGQDMSLWNIRSANPLSNNAVILPRYVIEDIGLYDPRIVLARQCDWDLWRRIGDKYLMQHVDVAIGEVDGPATSDSLGTTYLLDPWASDALMRSDRNKSLRPDAFGDCDLEIPTSFHGDLLSRAIDREFAANYLARHPQLNRQSEGKQQSPEGTILVVAASHEVSTSLCFDHLPNEIANKVRVISLKGPFGPAELARASCLVLVRFVELYSEWIKLAEMMKIPVYYFLDDNFPELAKENFALDEDFSRETLRERLREFDGVLLSSRNLVDYFETHLIHPNLLYFPPCYSGDPIEMPPQAIALDYGSRRVLDNGKFDFTIAFAGGIHRQAGLKDSVIPALRRLAKDGPTFHLVVAGCSDDAEAQLHKYVSEGLKITCLPIEVDWKRTLLQLAQFKPDVLIHGPSSTVNNDYKTLNAALNAHLLNAVLLAPHHAPFDAPEFAGCSRLVDRPDQAKSWLAALSDLLSDPESWKKCKANNAKYCEVNFAGKDNVSAIEKMLESAPAVGFASVESRLRLLVWVSVKGAAQSKGPIQSKEAAQSSYASDLHSLNTSLVELARMRKSHRRYRSLRLFLGRDDLWSSISPAFEEIRRDITKRGARKSGMKLELSDSLHDRPYAEYPLVLRPGKLRSISCAFASEGIHEGIVGLEILSSDGTLLLRKELDLSALNLHTPVVFDAKDIKVSNHSDFRARIFARSDWPLYVFEFAAYRGLRRNPVTPFAQFEYAKDS